MKTIRLGSYRSPTEYIATVDDADYERLTGLPWKVWHGDHTTYAGRVVPRSEGGGAIAMHREIMGVGRGGPPVDHIDGNGLNNQRTNLRIANHMSNAANRRKRARPSTSRYVGVSFSAGRWRGTLTRNKHRHYLGTFESEDAAAAAVDALARQLSGEFARLNLAERRTTVPTLSPLPPQTEEDATMPLHLMSLTQAAEALGLSRGTLKIQALKGRFRAEKIGRSYVVTPAEVERYRREHLRAARPNGPDPVAPTVGSEISRSNPTSPRERISVSDSGPQFGESRPAPKPKKK